jgi:uncharacterized membrane protein HdeD (DUF308 family)
MKINRFGKWSLSSLNGLFMIGFGIITIAFPGLTIAALAIYFAIAIFLGGIIVSAYALKYKSSLANWKSKLLEGIISVILGVTIILYPNSATAFLVIIIGLWAVFIGSVFIISYFSTKAHNLLGPLNLISGIVSLLLGAVIIFNPFESTRFLIILIGVYSIIYGLFSIIYTPSKSAEE